MVAADKGHQSIVEALLEGGVDVNYKHQVNLSVCTSYSQAVGYTGNMLTLNRQWGGLQSSLLQRMAE